MIRPMSIDEISDHSVTQIAYAKDGDGENYWSEDSLYLNSCYGEENSIVSLTPYILVVFPNFNWYGPNRVTLEDWGRIRALATADPTLDEFFASVDKWLNVGNGGADHFWIFGP